jgi:hypothetical protein
MQWTEKPNQKFLEKATVSPNNGISFGKKNFPSYFLKRADVKYDSELCIFYSTEKK